MAIVTDKLVFLHTPKTGGWWIKHILERIGENPYDVGHQHEYFPSLLSHRDEQFFRDRFVFTAVRHPLTWYQSRWAFRLLSGWQPRHPLDYNCASNDFKVFVSKALRMAPNGWCSWLYDEYTSGNFIDFVAKNESLVDDFIYVLKKTGHSINEDEIRNVRRVNSSDINKLNSKHWARYTPDLFNRVMAVESNAINRYYPDYVIDPSDLCGHDPY